MSGADRWVRIPRKKAEVKEILRHCPCNIDCFITTGFEWRLKTTVKCNCKIKYLVSSLDCFSEDDPFSVHSSSLPIPSPPPPPPTLELGYMHLSTPSPTDEDCRLSEPFLPCGHMCIQTNRHAGTNTHNFSHHPGIPWKLGMSAYRDKCCRSVDYFFADPDHIVADPYYFIANRIIFLPIRIITDSDKNLSR